MVLPAALATAIEDSPDTSAPPDEELWGLPAVPEASLVAGLAPPGEELLITAARLDISPEGEGEVSGETSVIVPVLAASEEVSLVVVPGIVSVVGPVAVYVNEPCVNVVGDGQ